MVLQETMLRFVLGTSLKDLLRTWKVKRYQESAAIKDEVDKYLTEKMHEDSELRLKVEFPRTRSVQSKRSRSREIDELLSFNHGPSDNENTEEISLYNTPGDGAVELKGTEASEVFTSYLYRIHRQVLLREEEKQITKALGRADSTEVSEDTYTKKSSPDDRGDSGRDKNSNVTTNIVQSRTNLHKLRAKRAGVHTKHDHQVVTVELFLVIDFVLFEWWNSLAGNLQITGMTTLKLIHEYYSYIFHGIDTRLQSLAKQGVRINAAFVGIYVAQEAKDSYWTMESTVEGDSNDKRLMVNASEALEKFQLWIDNKTDLPKHDHAILFTGTNLTYAGSAGNTGLAFGSSMCRNISNSSIVEDQLDIRTVTFATQQVSRSLGANDDMDNNDCLEFFNYIMAPKLRLPIRSFASNRWKFSTCSRQYIKDYLTGLDEAGLNCLYDTNADQNHDYDNDVLFGQVQGAKRQCQNKFGPLSDVCRLRIGTAYSKICSGLLCLLPDADTCDYILPADGTLCGNRKYCWQGTCQSFDDAEETSDTCVFGNDPNIECDHVVSKSKSSCYKESIRYRCCQSCESIAFDIAGCEYGDRITDCGVQGCIYGDDNYIRSACCLTCSNGPTPYSPPLVQTPSEPATAILSTTTFLESSATMSSTTNVDSSSTRSLEANYEPVATDDPHNSEFSQKPSTSSSKAYSSTLTLSLNTQTMSPKGNSEASLAETYANLTRVTGCSLTNSASSNMQSNPTIMTHAPRLSDESQNGGSTGCNCVIRSTTSTRGPEINISTQASVSSKKGTLPIYVILIKLTEKTVSFINNLWLNHANCYTYSKVVFVRNTFI